MTRSPSGNSPVPSDEDDFIPLPLATDLPAGTSVGDYTVECKLGDGGMATVYGATHPLIGKKAAIKVMNPALSLDAGLVERFVLEAQAVNKIGHPNIVDVFSFGKLPDGRSYFVMEWLPGETLYARLWSRRLTLDEALDILDQICDALEAAHEAGIVHRDLKPANVFLTPRRNKREQVKLLDFGVAKLMRTADDVVGMAGPQTQVGQVVGTPEYISPEQARGKAVDGKCDVYAMGIITWEMILGERPFQADNSADLVRLHLTEKPPSPRDLWPEIPTPLEELMLSMLEKKASERPSPRQVRAVIRELRGTPVPIDFGEGDASFTPAPSGNLPSPPTPMAPRKRRPLRALGFVAAVALAGTVGTLVWRWQNEAAGTGAPTVAAQPSAATSPYASTTAAAANGTAPSPGTTAPSPGATAPSANKTAAAATSDAPAADTTASDSAPTGTVVVRVDAPDARIELDGELVAQAASGARVKAARGAHALSVTAPGRKPFANRFSVAAGATVEIDVHLHGRSGSRPSVTSAPAAPSQTQPATPKRQDPDYLVDPFSGNK